MCLYKKNGFVQQVPYYGKKRTKIVKNGNVKKIKRITNSTAKSTKRKIRSMMIRNDFIPIPIKRENQTSPCLYSFFIGTKNVLRNSVSEKSCKNALLRDSKYLIIPNGASRYQNFKNQIGNNMMLCIEIITFSIWSLRINYK